MNTLNQMSRRNFLRMSGLIGASAMLAGCGGSSDGSDASTADADTFRIGGIGPVTGGAALYGIATKFGAQVAVDEVNAEGKIKMVLNWQDDEHDPEKSVNAYNTLKDWDLQILVGTTTNPCVAVSALTDADRIFQLTPSASSVNVLGGEEIGADGPRKDNVFQMCFTDPNQGIASAQYIDEKGLGSKIAIIYNNADAYSTGIYQKFETEAEGRSFEIVSVTTFTDDSATDFSAQLNKAKDAGADLIFLPIYYTPASIILKQASDMGYAPKFFGVDGMDGILDVEGFDTSLAEGVMLLTPFVATATDEATQAFDAAYKAAANTEQNPIQFAADAYDCVKAIALAIEQAGITPDMATAEICDTLIATFTSDSFEFSGLTCPVGEVMTWSTTGEVTKDPKGMVIENGVYQPLD